MSDVLIHDGFSCRGTDIEAFWENLQEIDDSTDYMKIHSKEVVFYSLIPDECTDKELVFRKHIPGNHQINKGRIGRDRLLGEVAPEVLKELMDETKMIVKYDGCMFLTSNIFVPSIGRRVGLSGRQLSIPREARDAYLADICAAEPFHGMLMYRNAGRIRKAFSVFSKEYTPIPQMSMKDILNNFGEFSKDYKCHYWEIDNFFSSIYLEFPKKADELRDIYGLKDEFVPGICLSTSDVGMSSFTVTETWRHKDSVMTGNIYKAMHKGEVDFENINSQVTEKIFEKYEVLPERLCELLMIDITDPKQTLNMALKKIDLTKAIGQKETLSIKEQLMREIAPCRVYTAYDIALMLMSLPERCTGLPAYAAKNLANAVMKAPFVDYGNPEESTVLLTA